MIAAARQAVTVLAAALTFLSILGAAQVCFHLNARRRIWAHILPLFDIFTNLSFDYPCRQLANPPSLACPPSRQPGTCASRHGRWTSSSIPICFVLHLYYATDFTPIAAPLLAAACPTLSGRGPEMPTAGEATGPGSSHHLCADRLHF